MVDEPTPLEPRPGAPAWVALAATTALAAAYRLPDLGRKLLHSDEGVNGWFTLRLLRQGQYCYNPENYHGPFLYYADLVSFWLLGTTDVSLRLPGALAGVATATACFLLLPELGLAGAAAAAALLAIDSAHVYFARTAIHEVWLVLFTLAAVCAAVRFPRRGSALVAAAFGASVAGMFANKETAALTVAALGLAWAAASVFPAAPDPGGLLPGGPLRAFPGWVRSRRVALGVGAGAFVVTMVAFFSSFGACWKGVPGFFEAYLHWSETASTGLNQKKDATYFLGLLGDSWLATGLAVPGAVLALVRRDRFAVFLVAWTAVVLGIYSAISYKTPWCVLSITLPMHLLGGWFVGRAVDFARAGGPGRLAAAVPVAAAALAVPYGRYAHDVNFVRYDDPAVPYVYVQTVRGFRGLVDLLVGIDRANGARGGLSVVNIDAKNPTRWYMYIAGWRWKKVRYEKELPPPEKLAADIVVCDRVFLDRVRKALGPGYEVRTFPLRPGHKVSAVVRTPLFERWVKWREEREADDDLGEDPDAVDPPEGGGS